MSTGEFILVIYSITITAIMILNNLSTNAGMKKLKAAYGEIEDLYKTRAAVLVSEIERLKRGDFTEEEFQSLCHNFDESDECRFKAGCEAYQRKLFGVKEPIPADIYYDSIYCRFTTDNPKLSLPPDFYEKWISRSSEFPPIEQMLRKQPTSVPGFPVEFARLVGKVHGGTDT